MATTEAPRRAFTDEQMQEFLRLSKTADSVELKLTIPESAQRSAVLALDVDPLQAEIRQVFFLDTPDLALDRVGVVARARRSQKKGDDTVVKLRPVEPDKLPKSLRRLPEFGVEVDASPGGFVCSGSLKGFPATGSVREAMGGRKKISKLFSKEQKALFAERAPEGVTLDDLTVLGPIFVLKLKQLPEALSRKLVGEFWLYPNGQRILELSTKSAPAEALQVAGETRAYLVERGVDLGGEQQTKTRTALEFFSTEMQAAKA